MTGQTNGKAPPHVTLDQGRCGQSTFQMPCIPNLCTWEDLKRCDWNGKKAYLVETKHSAVRARVLHQTRVRFMVTRSSGIGETRVFCCWQPNPVFWGRTEIAKAVCQSGLCPCLSEWASGLASGKRETCLSDSCQLPVDGGETNSNGSLSNSDCSERRSGSLKTPQLVP